MVDLQYADICMKYKDINLNVAPICGHFKVLTVN